MQSTRPIRCLTWLSLALLGGLCSAQVMQQPGTMPGQDPADQRPIPGNVHPPIHHPAEGSQVVTGASTAAAGPADKATESPALPPSLGDKPAEPATITLDKGLLAIHADNSSLSAILKHVAATSGMTVDGFQEDQRVFGVYGPGNPTDILSSLLQDAGYNFLMVGTTGDGTPRELLLTARTGGSAASPQPQSEEQPDEDDSDNSSNTVPEEPPMPERPAPIPGASTAPPNADGQHVKTPAEIIQELQRLRQQQQNPQ